MTGWVFGAEKPGNHRAIELVGRVCDWRINDDTRAVVMIEQRPQRVFVDVVVARYVPIVAIVPDEANRAVFTGIDASIDRRPGTWCPRWNLGLERRSDPVRTEPFNRRNAVLLKQPFENRQTARINANEQRLQVARVGRSTRHRDTGIVAVWVSHRS